jgi:hypothetical protein
MSADLDMNNNDINEIKTAVFQGSTSGNTTVIATAIAGTTTLTLPSATDTLVGKATTDTLTNKTLTSPTLNSPTMTTPSLGVATATSINKVTITAPATSATLTLIDGTTLTGPAATGTLATLGNTETFTGQKTFSNGTYSALFTGGNVGVAQSTPAAPLHVGDNSTVSTIPNIASSRSYTGSTSPHDFTCNSTFNLGAAALGINAYDSAFTVTGTTAYNHLVSFQSRPTYGSSSTIDDIFGCYDAPTINTGTATNRYGFYAAEAVGTGAVTNNYGFYCAALTKGGTLDYAFYSAGTTPSKFNGNVDVLSLSVGGTDATGAWSSYTPTVTAGAGSFTTVSASGSYKQIGKTVAFDAHIVITTNGTAASWVTVTLPVASKTGKTFTFSGIRSVTIALTAITGATTSVIDILDYNAAYPGASGRNLHITGVYEAD